MSRAAKPRTALSTLSLQCCSFPLPKTLLTIHFVLAFPSKQMTVKQRVLHGHRLLRWEQHQALLKLCSSSPSSALAGEQTDGSASNSAPPTGSAALGPWHSGARRRGACRWGQVTHAACPCQPRTAMEGGRAMPGTSMAWISCLSTTI